MPKKKITASASAASATPTTADVPALPPAASTVLSLLDAYDGTTASGLVDHSGLGRSTVTKALSALHEAGLAVRQEGGHEGTRRVADRWFAAPGATTPAADAEGQTADNDQGLAAPAEVVDTAADEDAAETMPDNAADNVTAPAPSEAEAMGDDTAQSELLTDRRDSDADSGADAVTEADTSGAPNEEKPAEEASADGAPDDETEHGEMIDVEATEADSSGPGRTDETSAETGSGADHPMTEPGDTAPEQVDANNGGGSDAERDAYPLAPASDESSDRPAADGTAPSPESAEAKDSSPRLGKGELRAQVEAHLIAHPEQAFTSTQIHHVLNRSSGAIANACDKLVADKKAVVATEKPRRFQWNPAAEPDAA